VPNFESVRTIAMSLPEAYERSSYNTPAFYVGKKLFARLREDGCSLVVNAAEDRLALSQMDPNVFSIPEHYRKYEMMVIDLRNVQPEELERLLIESWHRVAPKNCSMDQMQFLRPNKEGKMIISESVKQAWQINEGMNQILLEYLTPEMLTVQTPSEDWTIAGYLAHLAASKKWWGTHLDEEQVAGLPDLYEETTGKITAEKNPARIKDTFEQTSKIILETAENASDKGKLPYPSIDVFLIQTMIHDGHHRGQILLSLRSAGYTPPNDDDFWGGWWTDQG
jgi:uncharacterized damage-inducible protein DinB